MANENETAQVTKPQYGRCPTQADEYFEEYLFQLENYYELKGIDDKKIKIVIEKTNTNIITHKQIAENNKKIILKENLQPVIKQINNHDAETRIEVLKLRTNHLERYKENFSRFYAGKLLNKLLIQHLLH